MTRYLKAIRLLVVFKNIVISTGASEEPTDQTGRDNHVIFPIGPCMCRSMCESIGICSVPRFSLDRLMCYLDEMDYTENKNLVLLPVSKGLETDADDCDGRRLSTRLSGEICVTDPSPAAVTNYTQARINITVTEKMQKKRCSVVSMTTSKTYEDLIYLILMCKIVKTRCLGHLYFVDMKKHVLLEKSLELCEREEGERQIFSGPCVKDKQKYCIYSVNVGAKKLHVFTYIEPSLTTKKLRYVLHNAYVSSFSHLLCDFHKNWGIPCIESGGIMCKIALNDVWSNGIQLNFTHVNWKSATVKELLDFRLYNFSKHTKALFLTKTSFMVAAFDFARKKLKVEMEKEVKAKAMTIYGDLVLLHARPVEEPFYMFRMR